MIPPPTTLPWLPSASSPSTPMASSSGETPWRTSRILRHLTSSWAAYLPTDCMSSPSSPPPSLIWKGKKKTKQQLTFFFLSRFISFLLLCRPNTQLVLSCTIQDGGNTWASSVFRARSNDPEPAQSPCPTGVSRQFIGFLFTQNAAGRIPVYNCSYLLFFFSFISLAFTSLPSPPLPSPLSPFFEWK